MNYKTSLLLYFAYIAITCFEASSQNRQRIGLRVGNQAPNFELPMIDETILSLDSLRGKIVFIDFWASWCRGCRNKESTIAIYNQYKDKQFHTAEGFVVLSVSFDKDKAAWLNAIEKDGLIWDTHVNDFKGFSSEVAKLYRLRGLPQNVLLDGKGIVVARNIGTLRLHEELQIMLVK